MIRRCRPLLVARTATIKATEPSGRSKAEDLATRIGYYTHIAEAPGPTVTVIEDIDEQVGFGAPGAK